MSAAPAQTTLSPQDLQLLRQNLRKFLERHWPADRALALQEDAPHLRWVWQQLLEQGLAPLAQDGVGGGLALALLVMEELGRAACPAPMLGMLLANFALAAPDRAPHALASWQRQLQSGQVSVAVSLGAYDRDAQAGSARLEGGCLSGELAFVEGVREASHLLILAEPGPSLALVSLADAGVRVRATPGLAVPALARVSLERAQAVCVPASSAQAQDLARLARLALMARALGAAHRVFELAVDYAKLRKQFGRVIGSFQAIAHKLADGLMSLEGVRLTMQRAAARFDAGSDQWRIFAASACAFASPALRQVSLEAHHVFCAIGYSQEHEAPRHFRRIHADTVRHGGVERALSELAAYLLDEGGSVQLPDYDLGEAANGFRQQVRDWLRVNWSEQHRSENRRLPFEARWTDRSFLRRLGEKGWIAVSWPKAFGGDEASAFEQLAYVEELSAAGAPAPGMSYQAHALIKFGTPAQQARYLPGIRRGEITFCLGYSEPEAGSDLASLRTSAVRDGDEWVINGQKVWTTHAEWVDNVWLAARTDPDAEPRHAGISMFIVPLNSKGITVRPSLTLYGGNFCTVFYDNVRVPLDALVGPENGGWSVLTTALADERMSLGGVVARIRTTFSHLVEHARRTDDGGQPLAQRPAVRASIAQLAAQIEVARELLMNSFAIVEAGGTPVHEAAMSKAYSGELMERLGEACLDIAGMNATLSEGADGAILDGEFDKLLRHSIMYVVGGGTAQIQRNLIAARGLGLPR